MLFVCVTVCAVWKMIGLLLVSLSSNQATSHQTQLWKGPGESFYKPPLNCALIVEFGSSESVILKKCLKE